MQFMERSKKICHFPDAFGSKYENERLFFFENIVSSKYSCGFIQRKFGHHTKFFLSKVQEMFDPVPRSMEKTTIFEKNPFFPKRSSRRIESSFDKRSELFLLKVRNWQNRSSNLRNDFLKMFFWSRIMQFRDHSRKFLPFSERFCLKVWKRRICFKKNIVLKLFPWALPASIRPPYQSVLAKSPRSVWSNFEKQGKNFSKKILFLSKRSSALIESSFVKRSELFLPKVRNR